MGVIVVVVAALVNLIALMEGMWLLVFGSAIVCIAALWFGREKRISASDPGVTFRAAGLEWQTQPADREMTWESAKAYAEELALAGGGWRLHTKDELQSLYATKSSGTASFPGMDAGGYWSSSAVAGSSGYAWDVSFYGGYTNGDGVGYGYRVRCVR